MDKEEGARAKKVRWERGKGESVGDCGGGGQRRRGG